MKKLHSKTRTLPFFCNPNSGCNPAELVDTSRLAAQEDWRQEMRRLKPVGYYQRCIPTATIATHTNKLFADF